MRHKLKKIKLSNEQIRILNDLCLGELLSLGTARHNKYIDKVQVETMENKLRELIDILVVEE